jgi:hypothetical protein
LQQDDGGEVKDARYSLYKDARGVLKVTAPTVAPSKRRK